MTTDRKIIDAYERSLLQLLLRYELPADCEVRIEITTKGRGEGRVAVADKAEAETVFSLKRDAIDVKSTVATMGLRRFGGMPTCW